MNPNNPNFSSRPFACDSILIIDNQILLVKRGHEPSKGFWALPGGLIEENETAETCLVREMKEETGLDVVPVTLVGIYSDPARDPKRKVIAAAYLVKRTSGVGDSEPRAGDDAAEVAWFPLTSLPKLAFDHEKIIRDAISRMKTK